MSDKRLIAGLVQHACGHDHEENISAGIRGIRRAVEKGAQLVLLQELHGSLYFCQTEDPRQFENAQTIPGPDTDLLGQLAAELGVVIVTSVFERGPGGVFHNTAVVLDSDGCIAGCYRKMHIPNDPGYHEKYYFLPGDTGFNPVTTSVGRLGVLLCWDQWFPEAARLMALAGADLLLYPSAIGWDARDDRQEQARQLEAWLTVQRGHAIANCLPVMVCNRCGHEADPSARSEGIHFWGSSTIIGPQGELLVQAGTDHEAVLVARLDFARSRELRRIWPFFQDRRVDAYQGLLERCHD